MSVDTIDTEYVREYSESFLPYMSIALRMGDNKSIYKREAYTVLSLLGDFGGFADALLLIIGLFASFYSAKMFTAAIAAELPYSHPCEHNFESSGW